MKYKTTTIIKALIVSLIIFIAFITTLSPDGSPPNRIISILLNGSFLTILYCGSILLYRFMTCKIRQFKSGNLKLDKERVQCASISKSTHIVKKVLKVSLITYCVCYVFDADSFKHDSIFSDLAAICSLVIFCCCGILLYQSIIGKFRQYLSQDTNNIEQGSNESYFTANPQSRETTSYTNLDNDDRYNNLDQQQDFSHVGNRLTTIWTDDISHVISFDYPNPSGYDVTREIILTSIQINEKNEVHFVGFCFDLNDHQTFIANKISSNIEYADKQYRISKFLTEELGLDLEYVMGLVF